MMSRFLILFGRYINLDHLAIDNDMMLIRMRMTIRVCLISFLFGLSYCFFLVAIGLYFHTLICFINAFGFLVIAYLVTINRFEIAKIFHTINACWGIFAFASYLGIDSGVHLFILLAPIIVLSLYDLSQKKEIFISILIYIVTFLVYIKHSENIFFPQIKHHILSPTIIDAFYIVNVIFVIILSTTLVSFILSLNGNLLNEILLKNKKLSATQKMLSNEVSIRLTSEEKIKVMYEELQVSYDRLQHFNQMVSHNLRSPIANLIGLSNLMEDNDSEESEKLLLISKIKYTAIQLDEVIKDMNQILSINSDLNEVKTYLDLSHSLQKVVESEGVVLDNVDFKLEVNFEEAKGLYTVSSFVHSIFHNLLSNAMKYRQPDRPLIVKIKSFQKDNLLTIEFVDNGLGVDLSTNTEKIFKPYARFHADIDGKGIGLYLVQSQVQMLGGKISVVSQVGEGTTFTITLLNELASV
jgi:signal transduction histidine kinase